MKEDGDREGERKEKERRRERGEGGEREKERKREREREREGINRRILNRDERSSPKVARSGDPLAEDDSDSTVIMHDLSFFGHLISISPLLASINLTNSTTSSLLLTASSTKSWTPNPATATFLSNSAERKETNECI